MKKVGIVTIVSDNNYGNRLQNYATQEILKKIGTEPITLKNEHRLNDKSYIVPHYLKFFLKKFKNSENIERKEKFKEFNNNINFSDKRLTTFSKIKDNYDFFVVGSDQVWNPNIARLSDVDLLNFAKKNQRISFSASFGISNLPEKYNQKAKKAFSDFKAISVRENSGKEIVEKLTDRNDVEVLVDPTMLLTAEEWENVVKKPKELKTDKYILNYFLGNVSPERKKIIEEFAKKNNCEIINILDKNSEFYKTGPGEFLYLEKNAFLICTDSFHSCVFSIIYNRPFIVFDREDKKMSMNSRIETLLNKFNLNDRKFSGNLEDKIMEHDYEEAYKILENERRKSNEFLKNALDMKS